jgi:hypothetical protein
MTAGTYYVWVIADDYNTSGETGTAVANDIVLASGTLTVTGGGPDLVVQTIGFSPTSVGAGSSVAVNWTMKNQGSATANASSTVVRITSSNSTAAGSDLGTVSTASLTAGQSVAQNVTVTAPMTAGTYYVWVIADDYNTSGETGTAAANDIVLASGTLTVD